MLPRMKNDLIDVIEACIDGTLDQVDLQFEDNAAVCVVLASDGYPVAYEKGLPITGLDEFKKHEGYYCFHAGTKFDGDQIVTNGGRVLGVDSQEQRSKKPVPMLTKQPNGFNLITNICATISEKRLTRLRNLGRDLSYSEGFRLF